MTEQTKTRLLAAICKLCPFCTAARRWPNSAYARKLKKIEKFCGPCKAYLKLKQKNNE